MTVPSSNPTGYLGLKEKNPPNIFKRPRDPTDNDVAGYNEGDFWRNTLTNVYYFLRSVQRVTTNPALPIEATWIQFIPSAVAGAIQTLTGDFGLAVGPDAGGDLDILGGTGVTTTGTPGSNLMTIAVDATVATSFITNPVTLTATPALGVLTFAGAGGVVVSGDGASTITITGDGGSGLPWSEVAVNTAMLVNNGYIVNSGVNVNMTLPATASVGERLRILRKGAGSVTISQNAGQQIFFNASSTTVGVAGTMVTTAVRETLELLCITDNTQWQVLSNEGNWVVS